MTERYTGSPDLRWFFWEGGFLAVGRASGVVPPHSHHAIQLVVAVDGAAQLKVGPGTWQAVEAAAVLPDVEHSYDASGFLGCMVLIDPESREGRWLRSCLKEPLSRMSASRLAEARHAVRMFWQEPPDAIGTSSFVDFMVRQFGTGIMPSHSLDDRVAKAIDYIRSLDEHQANLDEVAGKVFLSPSRFAHLFSDEVGIPFRRYLLWRRLTRAMVLVSRGENLSGAAHRAGFSDSAHFTRTFYQMFGIPPSAMLSYGALHEIPAPFSLARAN